MTAVQDATGLQDDVFLVRLRIFSARRRSSTKDVSPEQGPELAV